MSAHSRTPTALGALTSPYKGLAPFEDSELDEQLFFGRAHDRDVIAANVVASRLTVLYGPTGVGKSSVVRAGVARELRGLTGEPLVVVCDTWSEGPAAALAGAVAAAAAIEPGPLSDTIEIAAAEHHEIYLLLDQVEEYFVYHAGDGALGDVLAELVMRPELPVHVLIAVREDALARLDSFKRQLPGLLANRLRLEHLSAEAGRRAILGPIERFASLAPATEVRSIEPALVDAVPAGVITAAIVRSGRGRGSSKPIRGAARIEAPYLQVVMQRLWDAESEGGSNVLRLSTLERLGGPGEIVGEHLERALDALGPSQKALAAQIFNHLVTPSGTKIAHGASDLASWVGAPEAELEPVLRSLARERILRPVHGSGAEPSYEIFHDVLADAVLAWRAEFEAAAAVAREREIARRRHRRLLIFVAVAVVALAAMGAGTLYALSQRDQAQRNQATARAAEQRAKTQEHLAKAFAASAKEEAAKERRAERQTVKVAKQARAEARNARKRAHEAKLARLQADRNQQKAVAAANAAKRSAADAKRATIQANLSAQLAQRNANAEKKAKAVAQKALVSATALGHKLQQKELEAKSAADAYQAQSLLGSAPASSLTLAAEAAALDPALPLVEFTLRRSLLATRAQAVLDAGDTQTRTATFSPDGSLVLTAGDMGARLFTASGAPAGTLATAVATFGASFSKDGQTIAIAEQGEIDLWSTQTKTLRKRLFQQGAPTHATFTSDGRLLLAWGAKSARAWDVVTARAASRTLHLAASVTGAGIDPDGSRFVVATGAAAGLYELPGERLITSLPEPSVVTAVRFSVAGDTVATAGADGIARLWNSADGSPRCVTGPSDGGLTSLVFSHDGASLLTTDVQGDTRIWSTQTCGLLSMLAGQRSSVAAADFSFKDQYAVTAGGDRSARIFSLPDGTLQATLLGHDEALTSVAFSPDGTKVVTASSDGKARIWDARIDRPEQPLGAHMAAAASVSISPDGSTVASVGADGDVRLWKVASRRALAPIVAGQPLDDVAFSQDGKVVAAAAADGTTRLWNLKTRALVSQFAQAGAVHAIALSPDGKWLATAGSDAIARVFALHGHGAVPVELAHAATVNDVAFSPDSSSLATATADGLAQIWHVATWSPVRTFTGHSAAVNSVAFSPDGKLLVTAGLDHRARIWQVATGKTERVLTGHAGSVSTASFSADGRWVVTAGPRTGGIWPVAETDLDNDRLFFITDDHQRLTAATFAPTTSAPALWTIATAAENGDVATYTCALCAGTPELVHLAKQRIARLAAR